MTTFCRKFIVVEIFYISFTVSDISV